MEEISNNKKGKEIRQLKETNSTSGLENLERKGMYRILCEVKAERSQQQLELGDKKLVNREEDIEKCMKFFSKFNKDVTEILGKIDNIKEDIDNLSVNIKLGLDQYRMNNMIAFEAKRGVTMRRESIPWLIENCEERINRLQEKKNEQNKTKIEQIEEEISDNESHKEDLEKLYKKIKEQQKEIKDKVLEYRDKRKELGTLKNALREREKEYKDFKSSMSQDLHPSEHQDGICSSFELAIERYKAKLLEVGDKPEVDPIDFFEVKYKLRGSVPIGIHDLDSLPPSIVMDHLEENIHEKYTKDTKYIINDKLAKMQKLLKKASEYLDLLRSAFFLKLQRRETNYYSSRPDLIHIEQGGADCGIVCAWMVLADKNKDFLEWDKVEELLKNFEQLPPGETIEKNGVSSSLYPLVLKNLHHSITYQRCSSMTPDQLKEAISLGEPIIAGIFRERERRDPDRHAIIIDSLQEDNGELYVVIRDPNFIEGYEVLWEDFLEVWNKKASVPEAAQFAAS